MLKQLQNLPDNVIGVCADGTLTKSDYESVLIPLLQKEHRHGHKIRFLYQFADTFTSITPGAGWEDLKVGLKYLRLFERCAVVSDSASIRNTAHFFGSLLPCPIQIFENKEYEQAVAWLISPDAGSNLKYDLSNDGVLVLRPQGPLRREDFDKLSDIVDPWIESHNRLLGVVIQIEKFPGWENIGSLVHHLEFVGSHHRKVSRVAIAMNGILPEMMSKIASHFVEAEVKQFPFEQVQDAKIWARG
jgi:hypothetical protein